MAHGSVAPGAARPTAEAIAANRPPPARPSSYGGSSSGHHGGVGGGAKPTRVVRASDGVVYDPDQYDPDANQRSR
jgi:hypothetical protein